MAIGGGKAAILSCDLFKAYDRVNIYYLQRVLKEMNFPDVFISWVLLLHEGSQTRLLSSFLTDPIDVTFSVRQGDPIAMILFIIYMEPLLLRLNDVTSGYKKRANVGRPNGPVEVGVVKNMEGFVDNV